MDDQQPPPQQAWELRHLPSPELSQLADLLVPLDGQPTLLPLHSHVLATGSTLLRNTFTSTEADAKDSRERAVQQALAGEARADVLAFLSLLYDPVHVKEALERVATPAPAPAAPGAGWQGGNGVPPFDGYSFRTAGAPLARRAEAVLRLADKLDCSLMIEVFDEFLVEQLFLADTAELLRWLEIADRCRTRRLRARCVHGLLNALLQPPLAGSFTFTGLRDHQLDYTHWKLLSADTTWLLFDSLLGACRASPKPRRDESGGLLGQVREMLPRLEELEKWSGTPTST